VHSEFLIKISFKQQKKTNLFKCWQNKFHKATQKVAQEEIKKVRENKTFMGQFICYLLGINK
jgi:hypothetical protein